MSELRQDRTTGNWVLVAPHRGARPRQRGPGERRPQRLRFDPSCPFCPGNEAQLPGIVAETPAEDAPGWRLRVVPNKYPAVTLKPPPVAAGDRVARPAFGVHEVIIESPWHDAEPASMSASELTVLVSAYRARSRAALARAGIAAAVLFRNYGPESGASLAHPHAQVVALDVVPPKLAAMSEWTARYRREHGSCVLCDELDAELKDGTRIVEENNAFVALVPYAAEHPFEIWIVPKEHEASITALADGALGDLAALLGRSLRRLQIALDAPPYNFAIDSAPKAELAAPHWHWKLRIAPDVAIWGGFELGGGLPINPSSPENDSRLLRGSLD